MLRTLAGTLPLRQIAVYRKADGTFLSGFANDAAANIDPTAWTLYGLVPVCGNNSCFIAGDFMRIAMNTASGASLPFIRKSATNQTDLMQSFAQDPETGVKPVADLLIGPVLPFGTISTIQGMLPAIETQLRKSDTHASVYYLKAGK